MDIEAKLPEDFDELPDDKKVEELEALQDEIDGGTDAGAIKQRIVEELIRNYR